MMETIPGLTAVCGGIGAGKSVVCDILRAMGYEVYDCDIRARVIMERDTNLKSLIAQRICADAIRPDGSIDRGRLGEAVFGNSDLLAILNSLVHGAVRSDLRRWALARATADKRIFVETAILYQSGLDTMVDRVWEVDAPEEVRVGRVCNRNGLTPEQVKSRIDAQRFTPGRLHPRVTTIINDGRHSLLLQIHAALRDSIE